MAAETSMQTRREFLTACLRYPVAASLGAVAVLLAGRRGTGLPNNQTCRRHGICSGCGELDRCGLPQALSRKQAQRGK